MHELRPHAKTALRWFGPCLWVGLAASVAAADPDAPVSLQQLLKLPSGTGAEATIDKRGGYTRGEWDDRFRKVHAEHRKAESQLAATRAALEEKAATDGGQWRVAAPGIGGAVSAEAAESPLDYRLTQELRRNRQEVARTERRIQDLEVEANLAGVPADWRGGTQPGG
ncbi:MAG: hypothetical protein VX546_05720 [Myxococcota bacterium]|nr:hypothetical protein [Myxococcota bacterium]